MTWFNYEDSEKPQEDLTQIKLSPHHIIKGMILGIQFVGTVK